MALIFYEIEATFAAPSLLEMDCLSVAFSSPLVFQMEMGEFDHFEPLWQFLRSQGTKDIDYFNSFLILPAQIEAASQVMSSLWPKIHRTREFFHVDDDPFWKMRDLLERIAASGGALLTQCSD